MEQIASDGGKKSLGLVAKTRAPFQPDFSYDQIISSRARSELLSQKGNSLLPPSPHAAPDRCQVTCGSSSSSSGRGGPLVPIPPPDRSALLASSRCNPFILLVKRQEGAALELFRHEQDLWVGISAFMRSIVAQRHFQPMLDVLAHAHEKQERCLVAMQEREERAFLGRRAADLTQLVEVQRKLEGQQESSFVDDSASDATGTNEETKQAVEAAMGVGFLSVLLIPLRQHETKARHHVEKAEVSMRSEIEQQWPASLSAAANREHIRKHRERCIHYREERRQDCINYLITARKQLPIYLEEATEREVTERSIVVMQFEAMISDLASSVAFSALHASFLALKREQTEWFRQITRLEAEAAQRLYEAKEKVFRNMTLDEPWQSWFETSVGNFHSQSVHIQTLLERKIAASRVVQRFFRRRRLGFAGWRATHRAIGSWIRLHREALNREAMKRERQGYLARLYGAMQ